ncbi:MAG: hypothetical protein NW215_02995 [Hyphomicrobiales bacterium]|nr:hypothetical protein [Hyphomicrobiales bacterium]
MMSGQFDASLGYLDALSADLLADQQAKVEHWALMPAALANAKLHAVNEMNRLVNLCNRLAWGGAPAEMRRPSADEVAALLQTKNAEECDALLKAMRSAAEQRSLVARIEDAERRVAERSAAEEAARAAAEAEAAERAEFEAFDAAGKEARFQAWRAAR